MSENMTDEKSHTEAADPHGASQATDTRKNATCALSGQEKRSGGHLDQITATSATAGQFGHLADGGLIERIARAWASIDGKADLFDACKADPEQDRTEGYHSGYMAEAEELAKRAGLLPTVAAIRALPAAQDGAEVERLRAQLSEMSQRYTSACGIIDKLATERDALKAELELVTNADELRAELRRALAQIDSLEAEYDRRHAQTEAARDEARRMDLARNQFLGERNMLAEALRDIQRGDMTNMMELTEAEAARARATWALRKIGEPVGALRAEQGGEA